MPSGPHRIVAGLSKYTAPFLGEVLVVPASILDEGTSTHSLQRCSGIAPLQTLPPHTRTAAGSGPRGELRRRIGSTLTIALLGWKHSPTQRRAEHHCPSDPPMWGGVGSFTRGSVLGYHRESVEGGCHAHAQFKPALSSLG